ANRLHNASRLRQSAEVAFVVKICSSGTVRYRGLDNLDIANAIDFEMQAKIIGVETTRFEGNDLATVADQSRKQECVIARMSAYIKSNHPGVYERNDLRDLDFFIATQPASMLPSAHHPSEASIGPRENGEDCRLRYDPQWPSRDAAQHRPSPCLRDNENSSF